MDAFFTNGSRPPFPPIFKPVQLSSISLQKKKASVRIYAILVNNA